MLFVTKTEKYVSKCIKSYKLCIMQQFLITEIKHTEFNSNIKQEQKKYDLKVNAFETHFQYLLNTVLS